MENNGERKNEFFFDTNYAENRVGTIVPILDENVIVNSFFKFSDYRPIHFKMVIDR